MKNKILGFLSLALLLIPATSFAATSSFAGLIHIPDPPKLPMLTCSVQGSIKKTNNITNELTYYISYSSNYPKINAAYSVYGTVERVAANITIFQAAGATNFITGRANISINGNVLNTVSFPIKDNPGVTVSATLNGVKCAPKYFKTIPGVKIVDSAVNVQPDLNLKPNVVGTSSVVVNVPQVAPAPAPAPVQNHTCSMLIEAAPIDSDSILVGGAISFGNLKTGQYNYTVRGYRSDTPNDVTKYTGVYNAKLDTASGMVFGQDGKAFLFTYDSKVSTDAYIVTATLGNIDCSSVLFPSHLAAVVPENNGGSSSDVAGSVNGTTSSPISENAVSAAAQESTTDQNGVVAVGLTDEQRMQGENLGLLSKTGDAAAQAAVQEKIEKEMGFLPATGAVESKEDAGWTSRDSVVAGLLGAIFVAIVTYIVMKYRGMM